MACTALQFVDPVLGRFLAFHVGHPLRGLLEEDVRAVALGLFELAVVEDGRVEVGVAGRDRVGADTRAGELEGQADRRAER